jgi:hypothetical protein
MFWLKVRVSFVVVIVSASPSTLRPLKLTAVLVLVLPPPPVPVPVPPPVPPLPLPPEPPLPPPPVPPVPPLPVPPPGGSSLDGLEQAKKLIVPITSSASISILIKIPFLISYLLLDSYSLYATQKPSFPSPYIKQIELYYTDSLGINMLKSIYINLSIAT